MTTCKNCSANFDSNYCPDCGTAAKTKRIDKKYVLHELQHGILHVEKGFLYTTKQLLTSPGTTVKNFLAGDRARHYKPIGYVIISSILYTLLNHSIGQHPLEHKQGNTARIFEWIEEHFSYSNLIEIVFITFALRLFFRKRGYNFYEELVLMCYITGFGMLIGCISLILTYMTKTTAISSVYLFGIIVYSIWAIWQFYSERRWYSFIKAGTAYLFGFTFFTMAAMLLSVVLTAMGVHL